MKRTACKIFLSLILSFSLQAYEVYEFNDPLKEQVFKRLIEETRCLVCQNQNIADSDAPLAGELKELIFTQLNAGQSEQQIVDYLVQRYGDFVRYDPPLRADTLALWLAPFALLLIGLIVLLKKIKATDHA